MSCMEIRLIAARFGPNISYGWGGASRGSASTTTSYAAWWRPGEVEFYVSAFLGGLCGFQFHSALLGRIAAAGIGRSVELYPNGD